MNEKCIAVGMVNAAWQPGITENFAEVMGPYFYASLQPGHESELGELRFFIYAYDDGRAILYISGPNIGTTRGLVFYGTISKKIDWKQVY